MSCRGKNASEFFFRCTALVFFFFSSYPYNIKITGHVTESEFVILHGCNADKSVAAVFVNTRYQFAVQWVNKSTTENKVEMIQTEVFTKSFLQLFSKLPMARW